MFGVEVSSDDFYDLCDQEDILVWQNFLFAGGNYPASPYFMHDVEIEAEMQLEHVGHHGSLVLWAGNNEDYLLSERFGWKLDMNDEKSPWSNPTSQLGKYTKSYSPNLSRS